MSQLYLIFICLVGAEHQLSSFNLTKDQKHRPILVVNGLPLIQLLTSSLIEVESPSTHSTTLVPSKSSIKPVSSDNDEYMEQQNTRQIEDESLMTGALKNGDIFCFCYSDSEAVFWEKEKK